MRILVVGAGVVGTVYGANLAAAGDAVSVLAHGARTAAVARYGLVAREVGDGHRVAASVQVVADPGADVYDLVLVAVTRDQLSAACAPLAALVGAPTILLLGNSAGRGSVPAAVPGRVCLGFPGVGGTLTNGIAEYIRIGPQPSALEDVDDPQLALLAAHLTERGFAVQRVDDMDGWLKYHAVLVSCICAALYRCGSDTHRLGRDRQTLRLMCNAVTEGFTSLRLQGVKGMPRNLRVLHSRLLTPIAVSYWGRTMRASTGELWFGAHARHAVEEMHALGSDVLRELGDDDGTARLRALLDPKVAAVRPAIAAPGGSDSRTAAATPVSY
jgi:2-dehydropantoate 2-reductase